MRIQFSKVPQQLKPSPPAETHLLSYQSLMNTNLQKSIQQQRHQLLLSQIQQLHGMVYQKQAEKKATKQEYQKYLLMLSLEIQHQRQITSRYDREIKKYENSRNQLKNYYEMKLELIKKQLVEGCRNQIEQIRAQCNQDLGYIRENYCTKIALISQANRNKQFEVSQKQQKYSNYQIRINIIQSKLAEKQRLLQLKQQSIVSLSQKLQSQQYQLIQIQESLSQGCQKYQKQSQQAYTKLHQQQKLRQQIYQQFTNIKAQLQSSQSRRKELQRYTLQLKTQLQQALRKFTYVQNQLDKININRKTHKNQEYDKNPINALESQRETQRDKMKDRERQKQKDNKQFINKLYQEIEKLKMENQNMGRMLEGKDQKIGELLKECRDKSQNNGDKIQEITQNFRKQIQQIRNQSMQAKRAQSQAKKQLSELKQSTQKLDDEIRRLKQQIAKRDQRIRDLSTQIEAQADEFEKKLQYFSKVGQETQQTWKIQEKRMQGLHEKIQSQYLKQMMSQRKKIDELQLTLNQTHQLMANQAKQKKMMANQLQQLKKSKKK